eukprot:15098.XXX_918628_918828_1 [CDS] Oithona nana genome sequencing.
MEGFAWFRMKTISSESESSNPRNLLRSLRCCRLGSRAGICRSCTGTSISISLSSSSFQPLTELFTI